jgi:hypothetical protein
VQRSDYGALALLAIYLLAGMPTTLTDFDAGEFATIALGGGIAHPPGYPLYCFLLQTFAALRGLLGVVPALVLLSVLGVVGAGWLLLRSLATMGVLPLARAAAVLIVLGGYCVARVALSIEPFALNLLLAALVLFAALHRRWLLLGLAFGMGACNHHSLSLLFPLALLALAPRRLGPALLGLLVGLAPLSYFWILRDHPYVWGDWTAFWSRLPVHLLRQEYGTFALSRVSGAGAVLEGPWVTMVGMAKSLSFAALLPCAMGAWLLGRQHRWRALPYAACFVCTAFIFPALWRVEMHEGLGPLLERFIALPLIMLVLPLAVGLGRISNRPTLLRIAVALHLLLQWPWASRRHETFYEQHIANLLSIPEPDAVLIVRSDADQFGVPYVQIAHGLAPNVDAVVVSRDSLLWHTSAQVRALGLRPPVDGFLDLVNRLLAVRPVYLVAVYDSPTTKSFLAQFSTYPIGPMIRLLPRGAPLPSPEQLLEMNVGLYEGLSLPASRDGTSLWEAHLLERYSLPWRALAKAMDPPPPALMTWVEWSDRVDPR